MSEKRRHKRAPVGLDVLVNGSIYAKGTNISLGGLYVHTGRNFAVDSLVTVELRVLDKDIKVNAYVRNCQPSIGMGLSFAGLTYDQTHAIRQFVEGSLKDEGQAGKKKVLLADDNATQRRINKSRLVLAGFTVFEAGKADETVRMVMESRPDVVVLEPCMENLGGFRVLADIKASPDSKDIPVVVLSGRGTKADADRALEQGAHLFLSKSTTSPAKLCEHLTKLLGK